MSIDKPSLSDLQDRLHGAGFEPSFGSPAVEALRAQERKFGVPEAKVVERSLDYVLEKPDGSVLAASVIEMNGKPAVLAVPVSGKRDGTRPAPFEMTERHFSELVKPAVADTPVSPQALARARPFVPSAPKLRGLGN